MFGSEKDPFGLYKSINLHDENIEFVGRWDKSNSKNYHSYWGGAYFKIKFKGNKLIINLAKPVNIYVKIDNNPEVLYAKANGSVKILANLLNDEVHEVQVIAKFQDDEIELTGLEMNSEGELLKAEKSNQWIEFIGDSITSGDRTSKGNTSAYPWLIGESLGIKHTQISYCGIPLVSGKYYDYIGAPKIGMDSAYFNLMQPNHQPNIDWNFNQKIPNLIVINIGTNDIWLSVTANDFQSRYTLFIKKIREKLPKVNIALMIPFSGAYQNEIRDMIGNSFPSDSHIKVIETQGWLTSADFADGSHPSDNGHKIVADRLFAKIKAYL
jgi:lysophospholipase L1-like esterase